MRLRRGRGLQLLYARQGAFYTFFMPRPLAWTSQFQLLKRMQVSMPRAQHLSLALLIFTVVEFGHLHMDYSGARPGGFGLTRLERDLARRGSSELRTQAFTQRD